VIDKGNSKIAASELSPSLKLLLGTDCCHVFLGNGTVTSTPLDDSRNDGGTRLVEREMRLFAIFAGRVAALGEDVCLLLPLVLDFGKSFRYQLWLHVLTIIRSKESATA
jgi:hypothetical protein